MYFVPVDMYFVSGEYAKVLYFVLAHFVKVSQFFTIFLEVRYKGPLELLKLILSRFLTHHT